MLSICLIPSGKGKIAREQWRLPLSNSRVCKLSELDDEGSEASGGCLSSTAWRLSLGLCPENTFHLTFIRLTSS